MNKRHCISLVIGVSIALGGLCMTASAETKRFVQDRFAMGFWVDPPIGDDIAHDRKNMG